METQRWEKPIKLPHQKSKNLLKKHNLHWKDDNHILKAVGLLGQIGLIMVSAIVLLTLLGLFLDRLLGIDGICVIIGAVAGIFSGGLVVFRLLKGFYEEIETK